MRCLGWLSSWICEDAIAVHNMISGQAWHVRRNEEVQFRGERAVLRSWKLTVVVLLGLIVLRKVRSYSWETLTETKIVLLLLLNSLVQIDKISASTEILISAARDAVAGQIVLSFWPMLSSSLLLLLAWDTLK